MFEVHGYIFTPRPYYPQNLLNSKLRRPHDRSGRSEDEKKSQTATGILRQRVQIGRVFTCLEQWIGNFARGGTPEYNLSWMPHFHWHRYYEPRCFLTAQGWIIEVRKLEAHFLRAFAKLRQATISFVISAFLSFGPHGTTQLPMDTFSWNFIFDGLSKICQ
jgi:hypothetical protein